MVLEEKKIKKICNFYVSEYHLEIMLLPYISKEIDNEKNIYIITEKDLIESLNVVIDRINLDVRKKQKIKNLNWNNAETENIQGNSIVILVGSQGFINKKIFEIKEKNIEMIACYDYNETKNNMCEIVSKYDVMLNTLGINGI